MQRIERGLGGLVEGVFARVFKGEVQPVELAGALRREADARRTVVGEDRVLTVNAFTIGLGNHDFARLDEWAEPLGRELADLVREHAAAEHYSFVGPVSVTLENDPTLSTGTYHVNGTMQAADGSQLQPQTASKPDPGATSWVNPAANDRPTVRPAGRPRLEIGGSVHELSGPLMVIGRGAEADVRIDDPGVSRRHAELRSSGGDVEFVDAGSTNGSKVNGVAVSRAALRDGDKITLGSTTAVFRSERG